MRVWYTASFNEQVVVAHSQSDLIIRPFQRGDAPKARHLIETVYGDQAIFLCAVAEAEVVGTGAIKRLDSQKCEMTRMFVASTYRGQGIGRAIAEELIKFALGSGYDQVRLSSNYILTASHRLYERLGFQSTLPWDPDGETHSRYFVLRIGMGPDRQSVDG
jgi:GNAT superfamily N-acetyltransferase